MKQDGLLLRGFFGLVGLVRGFECIEEIKISEGNSLKLFVRSFFFINKKKCFFNHVFKLLGMLYGLQLVVRLNSFFYDESG